MKVNVTWTTEENAENAGKTCAKKAVLDLIETKIAIIYSSVKYDTDEMLKGAKSILGTAPIIGATSCGGIIVPDGYITSQNGFAGIMAIGDQETKVATAISERGLNARQTGKKVAIEAMKKVGTDFPPAYFMMVATPGDEEEYLKGIQDVIGEIPCFGGTAADDDLSGEWRIYTEDAIISNGVAVAFFYTNKKMNNILDGKYHETINSGVITKVTGKRELDEIDGIQALKKYCEWTNKKVKDVRGDKLLTQSVLKPLGIKTHNGETILIRHPMNGNTDYSINVGNDIAVNTAVIEMQVSKDELIKAPKYIMRDIKEKEERKPIAYFMIHCGGRKMAIEGRIKELADNIKNESENVPFLVPFTYGEFGRGEHTSNLCGGLMISATAFYE